MSSNTQLARGMFEIAQKRMVSKYPFHTHFLARWKMEPTHAVPTMAVTVRGSATHLLYNPDFVVSCSFDELAGVVHHEINHLLFEHVFMEPEDFPDEEALVIAQETSANEWIPEPLPGQPILLAQFPDLPANEDAATRYGRLARTHGRHNPSDRKSRRPGRKTVAPVQDSPLSGPSRVSAGSICGVPIDDHSVWAEARASGQIGRMAIRAGVWEAARNLTRDEWMKIAPALQSRIAQLARGDSAGSSCEGLDNSRVGHLDWGRLLRRYVGLATEERPLFNRPPRRFPELVGILPGRHRMPYRARVMAIVDTSGSMCAAVLTMIAAELKQMSCTHAITIVECDAKVQRVYPFRGTMERVCGRGGTDLRPPFDEALLAKVRPDVIICFTDGCGPAPDRPPRVPVIWCLSPGGHRPADWGREITLSAVDEDEGSRGTLRRPAFDDDRLSPYIRLPGYSRSAWEAAT